MAKWDCLRVTDMKDFDFEVMQKKQLVESARKRVNGSKSKKCTLPSGYLTSAQRSELNGKMESMNVNKPITWAELKAMPPHMAKEYIETLHRVHKASIAGAARMLEVPLTKYEALVRQVGAVILRMGGRQSHEDTETFARFCGQTKVELAERETPALAAPDEPKAECALHMEPERMTIVINGNLEKLAAYIKLLPMNGRLRMTLTLERTEEE